MTTKAAWLDWCDFDFVKLSEWPKSIRRVFWQRTTSNTDRFKSFCFLHGNGCPPGRIWEFMFLFPMDREAVRQVRWLFNNVKPVWSYWDATARKSMYMSGMRVNIDIDKYAPVGNRFLPRNPRREINRAARPYRFLGNSSVPWYIADSQSNWREAINTNPYFWDPRIY